MFSEKRIFSVKSCYHVLHNLRLSENSNKPKDGTPLWNKLWNISMPNSSNILGGDCVRIFSPLLIISKNKDLDIFDKCFLCNNCHETCKHIFLNYD